MINRDILQKIKKIHFIGIGGSGMCPMAEILYHRGYQLTGSDLCESDTLDRISKEYDIPLYREHQKENIADDIELIVYSAAIKADNPERIAALEKNIPCIERSIMIGLLADCYENSVAVAGTHGKTSTTAMLTQTFMEAGRDPSAIIGGKLPLIGGNSRVGKSDIIVCEACEYVDSFLQLHPTVSIILNVDADHLDYFKNLENILQSFHQFALQTNHLIVANGDDENVRISLTSIANADIVFFGESNKNDFVVKLISKVHNAFKTFAMYHKEKKLAEISLSVPGMHNVMNAASAFVTAYKMGVAPQNIVSGLEHFTGVHRRFEILGEFNHIVIADDFAHHFTELAAVLQAANSMKFQRVIALFQPHTFSRTSQFLDEFAKALSMADIVIISDILPVRENNTYNIHTKDLIEKIPGSVYCPKLNEMAEYAMQTAKPGDLILTLGGGDVYKCSNLIVKKYKDILEK